MYTTHILDVGVFKPFKSACKKLMADHPHRAITTDQIAGLIGTAWPQSLTPVNIMSGYKKCSIYPLKLGEERLQIDKSPHLLSSLLQVVIHCLLQNWTVSVKEYKKWYDEGYDIDDDSYLRWIRENKLELPTKGSSSEINSSSSKEVSSHTVETSNMCSTHCGGSTGSSLSEILVVPKPVAPKKKRQTVNSKATWYH